MKLKMTFIGLLAFGLVSQVTSFGFEDLQNTTKGCSKRASCEIKKDNRLDIPMDWKMVNCFCDDSCIQYGDCCLNAAAYDKEKMIEVVDDYECVDVNIFGMYYMQGKCSAGWNDPIVERLCLDASPGSSTFHRDPFLDTPATSFSSDITYKNFYCAVCNNEKISSLQSWSARVSCPYLPPVDDSFIKDNLQFHNDSWGIFMEEKGVRTYHFCNVYPEVPETVFHKIRSCKNYITTCSPDWNESYTEELCNSYTTIVYGSPPRQNPGALKTSDSTLFEVSPSTYSYRNYHCAKCNYVEDDYIVCYERDFRTATSFSEPVALSVLFDFGKKMSICNDGEIWDAFTETCRKVVCLESDHEYRQGRCVELFNNVKVNFSTTIANTILVDEIDNITAFNNTDVSKMEDTCDKMFLNETDFIRGPNGTVIVRAHRRTYKEDEYEDYQNGVLVCIPENYSRLMGWLTLIGLGISCLCIVIHLVAFTIVRDLRNLSGKNLASMCIALLAAYICFLTTTFSDSDDKGCVTLAAVMYFFFLASFTWMNVMAFDVWRTLQLATKELRVTAGKQWKKFILYSLYAWCVPAVAVGIVLSIDIYQPSYIQPSYYPQLGGRLCWFGQRKAILVYFAAPLAFIMMLNFIFFLLAVRMVSLTTRSTASISSCQPQKMQLKLYLKLALLMGLSWISGILAGYIQVEYLWYIFILLNAFQGLFILLAFTCTTKVRKVFKSSSRKSLSNGTKGSNAAIKAFSARNIRSQLESQDSNTSNLSSNACSTTQLSHLSANLSRCSLNSQKL